MPVCLINEFGEIFFENEAAKNLFSPRSCLSFLPNMRATLAKLKNTQPFSEEIDVNNKRLIGHWTPLGKMIWLVEWQEQDKNYGSEEIEMWQAASEALGLAFYVEDRHGLIHYLSPTLANILGMHAKEAIGRRASTFGLDNNERLRLRGKTFTVEQRILAQGKGTLIVLKDISAEVLLGSSLQEMREAVAKGDLSKRIAPPTDGTPQLFAEAVNALLAAHEKNIQLTERFLDIIARGNFRIRFKEKGTPLTKPLLQTFEHTLTSLVDRIKSLRKASASLSITYDKQIRNMVLLITQMQKENELLQGVADGLESVHAQLLREIANLRCLRENTRETMASPQVEAMQSLPELWHNLSELSFESNLLALNAMVISKRTCNHELGAITPGIQKIAVRLADMVKKAEIVMQSSLEQTNGRAFHAKGLSMINFLQVLEQTTRHVTGLQRTIGQLLQQRQKTAMLALELEKVMGSVRDEGFSHFLETLASFRIPGDDSAIDVTPREN